jgi:hypothetical protein
VGEKNHFARGSSFCGSCCFREAYSIWSNSVVLRAESLANALGSDFKARFRRDLCRRCFTILVIVVLGIMSWLQDGSFLIGEERNVREGFGFVL